MAVLVIWARRRFKQYSRWVPLGTPVVRTNDNRSESGLRILLVLGHPCL